MKSGIKKVFFYDTNEEDLVLLEEDEEDEILEIWEEEYYDRDKDYMYWNEEFGEYDEVKDEEQDFDDIEEMEEDEDDDILKDTMMKKTLMNFLTSFLMSR